LFQIWANVQPYDQPYRVRFDIDDPRLWRPFFTVKQPNQLQSIQPDKLNYFTTNIKFVREIEVKIENKLREKIQEWRPRYITKWNRYASTSLRQILTRMEKSQRDVAQLNAEPDELAQILSSYRMTGFPLNLPYSNINDIVDTVYATQVHSAPSSDIEHALAVHIHEYPNTVLSVWVYVATLSRKA
jgi:coiled-coil and C2 domain-containing protein 2A